MTADGVSPDDVATAEANRAVVLAMLQIREDEGIEAAARYLAPDFTFVPPQPWAPLEPIAGRDRYVQWVAANAARLLIPESRKTVVGDVVADRERVALRMTLEATTVATGATYRNHYAMFFRVVNGLITECVEYMDTACAQAAFSNSDVLERS